jgi:ParB family chromosome partitioning protein
MSKLTEKGRGINFDDVEDGTQLATDRSQPRTAIGAISASLAMGRGVEAENRQLKARLHDFQDATFVELIDPKRIVPSRFANRHELSFAGAEFADLKAQIAAAGRNVQPIKVRRANVKEGAEETFEIVFGHRRHRACLELGIPVAAVVEDIGDVELFAQMDRENRGRENLSPWEQGMMYKRALDLGLFPSQRQLAAAVGAQSGNVSTAIQLASLPLEVVAAFVSPLDLQYRWGADLKAALERDPEGVRARANEIAATTPRPSSRETLARLMAADTTEAVSQVRQFMARGKVAGTWEQDAKGGIVVRLKRGALSAAKEKRLLDFIERLFE